MRRVRKDLDKNKEIHLESTLALWPEAVDKSWACWRVGNEACWRVGKEASLIMRERGSMLVWKRRIVIKALRIFSHPICFCPTLPMKDYTRAPQPENRAWCNVCVTQLIPWVGCFLISKRWHSQDSQCLINPAEAFLGPVIRGGTEDAMYVCSDQLIKDTLWAKTTERKVIFYNKQNTIGDGASSADT